MPNAPQKHNPRTARQPDRRPAHERGYDHDWVKIRDERLRREPWCRRCELAGQLVVENVIVDHIIPVHVRPSLRLVIDNTQTLCRPCHAEKTEEDLKKYGAAR